eukprot:CAMPEP_0114505344 /NCGR_PEP_ID=MMETSP0109-20121206/10805_1 /TAXON_ID=29199 /ORGANISM="Chlorarachnion reptans, Strain CCCM449" /LENGTH=272 /DNA_ID=CAMNT_0001683781 /DNA_START=19 /DNA_END=837 /DNA_ORIENTATION=-
MAEIDEKHRLAKEAKHRDAFLKINAKGVDDQMEYFIKSFFFELGDEWKKVTDLAKGFKKAIKDSGSESEDLDPVNAAQFLQANGAARTALQRKKELKDVDLNSDGRISFLEYLTLQYKKMILEAYYKRHKKKPEEDLTNVSSITGVGTKLVEEVTTIPLNLEPSLLKAIDELSEAKKDREKKIHALKKKAAKGGVLGKAAQNELDQFLAKGDDKLAKIEIKLAAARKKNLKTAKTASKALKAEKAKEEAKEKEAAKAKKAAFKARAAMFAGK